MNKTIPEAQINQDAAKALPGAVANKISLFYTFGLRSNVDVPIRNRPATLKFPGEPKYQMPMRQLKAPDLDALRIKTHVVVEAYFGQVLKALNEGQAIKEIRVD